VAAAIRAASQVPARTHARARLGRVDRNPAMTASAKPNSISCPCHVARIAAGYFIQKTIQRGTATSVNNVASGNSRRCAMRGRRALCESALQRCKSILLDCGSREVGVDCPERRIRDQFFNIKSRKTTAWLQERSRAANSSVIVLPAACSRSSRAASRRASSSSR
jgi:hypothetical protein